MAKVIAIMGESGSGKTTSLRNLPPKETFYFDCDKKGLSWKGWKEQYSAANKNYLSSDDLPIIKSMLKEINDNAPMIKYIVIDTLNGIMVTDEVKRMREKGFDKWQDLAQCVWVFVDSLYGLRDDLTIIVVCHSMTQKEDDGYTFTRIKTSGKKLDKLCLETKFTTVLLSVAKNGQYKFITHADNSTVKTPMGAFEENEIDNDIMNVIKALEEY